MARKGDLARENLKKKIIEAFGENFVGEQDKKLYVWEDDSDGKVQFAISITMPKVQLGAAPKNSNDWTEGSSSNTSSFNVVSPASSEISPEDEEKIQNLIKILGIVD